MKFASLFALCILMSVAVFAEEPTTPAGVPDKTVKKGTEDITGAIADKTAVNFYDLIATKSTGELTPLKEYRGKVSLVVNTASKCGYTPQYDGLQALYKKHEGEGFVVLGFPSNDFLSQEPGTNEEIRSFCKINYGVTFPLFEKNHVTGESKQPVYKYLTENGPKGTTGDIGWNFEKFVINRKGEIVARFKSKVKPDDPKLVAALETALKEPVPPAPKPASKNTKGN